MRIAILSYEYPPETGFGGIGTYSYYQAHALARLGHDVHVFAGSQSPQRRTYRDGNVTVTRWRSVGLVERMIPGADRMGLHWAKNRLQTAANSIAALRAELKHGSFDVVEMPECGGEGALLNHLIDLPTVVRLHSPAELIMQTYPTGAPDRMLTAVVERLGISGARTITACSHWVANEVRSRMGIKRPISVIPNGIDLSLFDQDQGIDASKKFSIPSDRLRIFFANRLEERKGIHVVRDVMEPVLRKHPEALFVLAGADPDDVVGRELKPLLAKHGLEHGLQHLGKLTLPEVRACLKQSDVFMLPSIWENAPYSLLEAMSAGKAVVASDCGGVPEILRHEIDGIVAPTNDAAAFARALDRLLSDEKLRLRLGHSARSRVEARYTDEHVARRSLEVYEWALGAGPSLPGPKRLHPSVALGPQNWFQAWWLRNSSSQEQPTFDQAFAEVSLAELDFAHAVSARMWWSGPARGKVPETDYLDDLATTHRLRATEANRVGSEPQSTRTLSLPSTTHPLFEDTNTADAFLDELWRLENQPALVDWMLRELGAADFVDRASRNVALRRIALDAFRRRPCQSTHEALRRIYRDPETAHLVVAKDREFIAGHPKGKDLEALVERFGLHAPLRRPPLFTQDRRKKGGKRKRKQPAVTVLIPSYRHESYVRAAIESALSQTHKDVHVLVVDDASPDGTVAAAQLITDPRLEVRVNPTNLGLGGSIRAALATVTTPYVALLNSDDVFHPERLERCIAGLEADADAQLVATGFGIMDQQACILTKDTCCAIDVGLPTHEWVRWHDRISTSLAPGDWTTLSALLRHNHLATSSNVVCRTQFLVDLAPSFEKLRYCLDWHLFLRASIQGSLRFVPDPLLGYRLHGSNTVWFDDESRPGYVHEVNAVVADALRHHAAHRSAMGVRGEEVAEDIAGLLRSHALTHGETDGVALYLAEATAKLEVTPATFRTPQLAELAREALAGKRRQHTSGPDTDKAKVMRHLVAALSSRSRQIEPQLLERQHETAQREPLTQDLTDMLRTAHAAEARADEATRATAALEEARFSLETSLADTRATIERLEHEAARLKQESESTKNRLLTTQSDLERALAEGAAHASTATRLAKDLERAKGDLDEARRQHGLALDRSVAQAETETHRRAQDADRLEAAATQIEQLRIDSDRVRLELELRLHETLQTAQRTESELGTRLQEAKEAAQRAESAHEVRMQQAIDAAERTEVQHARILEELRRAAHLEACDRQESFRRMFTENSLWNGRAKVEARDARRALESSIEHRFGHFVLRKLKFGKALAPLLQLYDIASSSAQRVARGLREHLPGRPPTRVLLVWDGAFPDSESASFATFATALTKADLDVRIACARRASMHWLGGEMASLASRRMVVPDSSLLARRDRKWWQRRDATAAESILSFPVDQALRSRAFVLARNARACGTSYLHGYGLSGSGFQAFAAALLLQLPFGITLRRCDLHRVSDPRWRDVLLQAHAILVDSEAVARKVRVAASDSLPALVICPPTAPQTSHMATSLPARMACIGPFDDSEGLLTITAAVARLAHQGHDVQLVVLGEDSGGAENLVAFDWLRGRVASLGIGDRVIIRPDASVPEILRAVGEASIVVDARTGSDADPTGLSFGAVTALAAGRPLVGFREGMDGQVIEGKVALLSSRGDEIGLASLLAGALADASSRKTLGIAGQLFYSQHFAAAPACAEASARIRQAIISRRQ